MSNLLAAAWQRFWQSEDQRIDRHRILHDLLWHTPIPTDEAVALIHNYPAAVRQREESEACFPLHVACGNGADVAVIQALVQAWPRAASLTTPRDYETPLHLACLRNLSFDCITCVADAYPRAMRMSNRQNDLPLHLACRQQPLHSNVIQYLVQQYPAALLKKGKRGNLPLHVVLQQRGAPLAIVKTLITTDAMTVTNRDGDLPLHVAVTQNAALDVILCLVEALSSDSSNVLLMKNTTHGDTPLHAACRCSRGQSLATIQVLVQANRQALIERNKQNQTPLEVAQHCGADSDIIQWLSENLEHE